MKSKYIINSLVYVFLLIIFFSLISCKQHTHEWILSSVYTPSSCISTGKGQFTCNTCEETKVDVIPAKGHKEEIDKSIDTTCVSSGLTEGKHCYYCKYVIEEQQNISALGHNFENDICTRCNINYLHSLFTFSLNQNRGGYYITSYNGTESNLNIPTTYSNLPIVGIDKQAFSGNSFLENVTIPDSILTIGNNAFDNCTLLKNITFGSNVTSIGDMAFYGCYSLESIIIPNSVSSIGNSVFESCTSLKNVYCRAKTAPSMGEDVFEDISSTAKIYVPKESFDAYKRASGWKKIADKLVSYNFG